MKDKDYSEQVNHLSSEESIGPGNMVLRRRSLIGLIGAGVATCVVGSIASHMGTKSSIASESALFGDGYEGIRSYVMKSVASDSKVSPVLGTSGATNFGRGLRETGHLLCVKVLFF